MPLTTKYTGIPDERFLRALKTIYLGHSAYGVNLNDFVKSYKGTVTDELKETVSHIGKNSFQDRYNHAENLVGTRYSSRW